MRLIDADALIEAHYDYCETHHGEGDVFYMWSLELMRNAPTIEPTVNQWIPCTDQLPTKGLRVLMQLNNAWQIVGWYDMEDAQWFELIYGEPVANDRVLAWMELPNTYYAKGGEVNEKRRHILDQ